MSAAETDQGWSGVLTDARGREGGRSGSDASPPDEATIEAALAASDRSGRRIHPTTVVVAAIGLVLTIALVVATWIVHNSNEQRLLRQRAREAAAVVTAFVPSLQTPLSSSAEIVEATNGNDQKPFERIMGPLVQPGRSYVSASVWRLDADPPAPSFVLGEVPKLSTQTPEFIRAYLQRSVASGKLAVTGLLDGDNPRLGYAVASTDTTKRFVVYAEAALAANRTSVVRRDSAFSGLRNAIYIDGSETPSALLSATTPDLPLRGRRASETVPFGDTTILLVFSPTGQLGGALMALLPWIVAAVGVVATFGSATLIERLLRRRDQAERLARDNAHLYANQRSVAETLQHSLLPEALPEMEGLDVAFRYLPGASGVEIGGDWYDVIPLDGEHVMVVVGDVSGRGLKAGTVMASLRFAIRAFASQGDSPSEILVKLTRLVNLDQDGHFATVLCARVDVAHNTVTVANAGHPNPLMLHGETVEFVDIPVGVPIGVLARAAYDSVTVTVPPQATLLAFTDGLFERRGETIDDGLERLRRAAANRDTTLENLLTELVVAQACDDAHDDVAILGVRWKR
jgi:serine phosphatase RsbU (regulator of sigma subunit)